MAFGIAIYDKITYGPALPNNQMNLDSCKKYWWKNMLYINNFLGNKGTVNLNDIVIKVIVEFNSHR